MYNDMDKYRSIAFNCLCGSTLTIPWSEAPPHVKAKAIVAEIKRIREAG